jgi:co-chaperonin GroES (HSP10)
MIKPFGNNILVRPLERKQTLVADEAVLCSYGDVLAIGKEVKEIKVGDIIGFTVFGLNSLEIDNEKHFFIPETAEFLLGTIELAKE